MPVLGTAEQLARLCARTGRSRHRSAPCRVPASGQPGWRCRRRLPKSTQQVDRRYRALAGNLVSLTGWMLSPRHCRQSELTHKLQSVRSPWRLAALVECGSPRSQVRRDCPRAGSCLSSSSRTSLRDSSRASLRACAESRLARARPAKPIRSSLEGARQHVAQGFKVADQPLQNEASVIGIERRPGGKFDGCGHVVARHEQLQSKVAHRQPSVVRTGLSASCAVVGQSRHRCGDLLGQQTRATRRANACPRASLDRGAETGAIWMASANRLAALRRVSINSRSSSART